MSDDTISLNRTIDPPSVIGSETIDLGKERELRQLREQNQKLTERLANYDVRMLPHVSSIETYDHGSKHGPRCGFHPQVLVSMTTRSVTCRECGEELEPMDVLREFARHERRFVASLADLRKERENLTKEVDVLRKQRSSLRSQLNQIRKRAVQSP